MFGRLPVNLPAANADCSNIAALVQQGTNWDPYRKALDPSGYVSKMLGIMPMPNNYENPTVPFGANVALNTDGLNTAGFKWLRTTHGSGDAVQGTPFTGANTSRRQINGRFDHYFNQQNKLGVSYTYELTYSDGTLSSGGIRQYPQGLDGHTYRRPQVMTANFTSTLSSNVVNEARVGLRRTAGQVISAFAENPKAGADFVLNINGYPTFPKLGTTSGTTGNATGNMPFAYLPFGDQTNTRDLTPLWTYGDTLSWTRGKHALKFGGELRKGYSTTWDAGFVGFGIYSEPRLAGGDLTTSPIAATAISSTNMIGLAGTTATGNNQRMRNLLSFLAGSIGGITQLYYMNSPTKLDAFDDYKSSPQRVRDARQNEFSSFVKDDWKIRRSLTLNLGVRWEYYGVPWEAHGLTPGLAGGNSSLFGISGNSFNDWFSHATRGTLTQIQFVGPNSPNPSQSLFPKHWGNVGPAVGFAWQVPWFGEGKTTVRGGYQITYQNVIGLSISDPPTSAYSAVYQGDSAHPYLDMTNISSLVPAFVPTKPAAPILITDRSQSVTVYDPNYKNPYVQNITLALTRSVRPNLTVDLRYVGTFARKQPGSININIADFRYNGLKEAFDTVRAGGESDLLNLMMKGVTIVTGMGPVSGNAGAQMRASTNFQTNLANGNYVGLASTLNTYNGNLTAGAGIQGQVLRNAGFPENFIVANPQFSGASFSSNTNSNNYHSMQAQLTMRQTHGITGQSTYTWSKNLGYTSFTDPVNRRGDYTVLGSDRTHDLRANGSFALPIGPSKLLLGNTHGVMARVIEGWQLGWVADVSSGLPLNIGAQNMLYANGVPDIVGPFDLKSGGVRWGTFATSNGQLNGTYFDTTRYKVVADPQCASVDRSLASACTLQAIQDTQTGKIVMQNPLPGTRGTLGLNVIRGPLLPRIDGNLSKSFRVRESKTVQLRIDAYNVLNHPIAASPNLSINGTGTNLFGTITNKTGSRRFQGSLRLNF